MRACVLLSMPTPDLEQAEAAVLHSLDCARRQGALGWELRATMTLLQLRTMQARALLATPPVRNQAIM